MFFFFNDPATTEIYTLSLHDALPIYARLAAGAARVHAGGRRRGPRPRAGGHVKSDGVALTALAVTLLVALLGVWELHSDRKSTRLNSSHANISYAVFCLKKNKISIDA